MFFIVLHKPCQPQASVYPQYPSTYAYFSWTECSGDKVAPAMEYLVICANYVRVQRSSIIHVHDLRPNKQYSCSVFGIDGLGRLGETASINFMTNMWGKF